MYKESKMKIKSVGLCNIVIWCHKKLVLKDEENFLEFHFKPFENFSSLIVFVLIHGV